MLGCRAQASGVTVGVGASRPWDERGGARLALGCHTRRMGGGHGGSGGRVWGVAPVGWEVWRGWCWEGRGGHGASRPWDGMGGKVAVVVAAHVGNYLVQLPPGALRFSRK